MYLHSGCAAAGENRRGKERQKWQKRKPVRLCESVREALFAREGADAERTPLNEVLTKLPPPPILEQYPELLGELAVANAKFLTSNGWQKLVVNKCGRSTINLDVGSILHNAVGYLDYLRQLGAPTHSAACLKTTRSCRQRQTEAPTCPLRPTGLFVRRGVQDMTTATHHNPTPVRRQGYKWGPIQPVNGVTRAQRLLVNALRPLTYSEGNASTVQLAPKEAMQFGQAFQRLLYQIHHADLRWAPAFIAKGDILDGFYNVFVNTNGIKQFGIILPTPPG